MNGNNIGSLLNYSFAAPAPSAANSNVSVITDNQIANGTAADKLQATVRDASNKPVRNISVFFGATAEVKFGSGAPGAAGTCLTDSNGQCSLEATAKSARTYATQASIGGINIGSPLRYSFVAGPASAAHSGLRILTDNAVADGVQADQLEFLVRDAFDNPANGVLVTIASPGADVSFNAGAAGSAGSCTTLANGICTLSATSTGAAGGSKSSAVTVAGAALSGSFSAGGFNYGPSPAVFRFTPWVPRLQIVKQVSAGGGRHTFVFNLTGMQASSDSITLTGPGSADGAALLGRPSGAPITITEVASADWPEPPLSASCVDLASSRPGETFGSLSGSQLVIPVQRSPAGANLRCTFVNGRGQSVAGKVFADTGAEGGTANDAVANGSEPGLPGLAVSLGNCASTVHASTTTDNAGNYRLAVPPGVAAGSSLCVDLQRPIANLLGTGASIHGGRLPVAMAGTTFVYSHQAAADRVTFQWTGSGIDALNFGSVPASTFVQSASKTGRPGVSVQYGHLFTAGTAGSVSFSVAGSTATPPLEGWTETILADPGCSGLAQPGAAVLYPPSAPQTLAAGQTLCVLLRQSIPAQAAPGSRNQARVHADFRLAGITPPLTTSHELEDLTTVASEGVELQKEVRNVTQGSGFGLKNQARPGDVLEYRVTYGNHTPVPVNHLVISDSTPAYTGFVSAAADSTPTALGHCQKLTPADTKPVDCAQNQPAGGKGSITWTFDGPLEPGASGTVLFRVQLD
ncbi:Ig-like domain-containing protein [Xylophilus rhododendri]|uniref:Ig-like domain-containing protein n=1 Tax=Xylophilus rhododendri TaxID=2697032 RepID=UPI001E5E8F1C|nr:Ig-like domain-containing protein [Xylophilus rhododendri]